MKQLLTTAAVAAMLAASPALADDAMKRQDLAQAQTPSSPTQTQPPAQTQTPGQSGEQQKPGDQAQGGAAGGSTFLSAQEETDWLSSDLVGQSVQNQQGEALGDINNIVVNQDGRVVGVVIGVGGFLGIGEKDVAVSHDALEFKEQAEAPAGGMGGGGGTTGGGGSPMGGGGGGTTGASAPENPQDNMVIVLNTTRDQLEAAPDYKYIGEEESQSGGGGAGGTGGTGGTGGGAQ